MIHFMLKESEVARATPKQSQDPDLKFFNSFYLHSNPDDIYMYNSITFVYDHEDDIVYWGEYPVTHFQILRSTKYHDKGGSYEIKEEDVPRWEWSDLDDVYNDDNVINIPKKEEKSVAELLGIDGYRPDREDGLDHGYMLGRIGEIGGQGNPEQKCVLFWRRSPSEHMIPCLENLSRHFPYIKTPTTVVMIQGSAPFLLKQKLNIEGDQKDDREKVEINPKCAAAAKVSVDGVPTPLGTILGNLHAVNDVQRLRKMNSAFCGAEPNLRKELEKMGCGPSLSMLSWISDRFKQKKMSCEDDNWKSLKEKGAYAYRNDLRNTFDKARGSSDDDYLGSQFRTQKELDAAWDYLNKREHRFPSFVEWLNAKKRI